MNAYANGRAGSGGSSITWGDRVRLHGGGGGRRIAGMSEKHCPRAMVQRDQFAQLLGMELTEVEDGRARVRMALRPDHRNGFGIAHGGAVFALADTAFAAASNSHGYGAVSLSATMNYLLPGVEGTLQADAREVSRTKKVSVYEVKVTNEDGEVIAVFQGLAYHKAAVPKS